MQAVVVYRRYPDATIIALMPEIPCDALGHNCLSYSILDGYACADYELVIAATRPANPNEYAETDARLRADGYRVIVRQKSKPAYHARRLASASEFRASLTRS